MTETFVIDGNKIEAEYLESGAFAAAYRHGENVIIKLKNMCRFREALATLTEPIPHLPFLRKIEDWVYIMPFYNDVNKNSEQYTAFKSITDMLYSSVGGSEREKDIDVFINTIETQFPQFAAAFKFIAEFIKNNEGVSLDLSYWNMSEDSDGNIILRDPIADWGGDGEESSYYSS